MVQLNFDANNVAPAAAPQALPKGWYNVIINESEAKPTKDGTATYLYMQLEVIDGQYKGQKIFERLNLWHPNPVTQEIAYRQLSSYCHATGVLQVADAQQLHGIPFAVRVNLEEDKTGQYEPSNNVKECKRIENASAAPAGQGWQQQAAPAPQQAPQGWQQPAPAAAPPAQQNWSSGPVAPPPPQPPQGVAPPSLGGPPPQQQAPAPQYAPAPAPAPQGNPAAAPPPWAQ